MAYLSEFERAVWDRAGSSERATPEMALKATLDNMERGNVMSGPVKHIIVIAVCDDGEGGDVLDLIQAGSLSVLASEGAMSRAQRMMEH